MANNKGFTFIELLIIIAIAMIASVSVSTFAVSFIHESVVRDAQEGLVGTLREAQSLAMSGKENSSWGVKYNSDSFILFCGNSFSGRDPVFDRPMAINSNVEVSGFDEAIFDSPSGRPEEALPEITISRGSAQKVFSLNSEGAAE